MEVMAVVAGCHHRTAPRMDDREAALVTAKLWADLFDGFDFTVAELIAAVKSRAKMCPEAPEAADIIRVARAARTDRMARRAIPAGDEPNAERVTYPGDALAAPDQAEFPAEWDSDKRRVTYWYALRMRALPRTTAGWTALAEQAAAESKREAS